MKIENSITVTNCCSNARTNPSEKATKIKNV